MPKNSEARIRANNKYNAKAYDTIQLRVKKGERDLLQAYLKPKEQSLNGFINSCMSYCIENDVDTQASKPLSDVLPLGADEP